MGRLKQLVHEIHRRSLWQVVGIYLAGSWLALQVVEVLAETSGLPPWVGPVAIIVIVVFFPVVLATAFVQEGLGGRGEGPPTALSRREGAVEEALEAVPTRHRVFTWRNALFGVVGAFALLGIVSAGWLVLKGPVPAGVLAGSVGEDDRPSVAALPFVNLSADGDHAYFADGVHEQVLAQLSKIGSLKVISRTSVMEYRDEAGRISGNIPDIARALEVRHVLEGSLQRDADRIRLTVQLIDADTDEHVWAETYDRTLDDIFEVQSELAANIASALDATLSPAETERIEARATESAEAYSFVLRGDDYFRRAQVVRQQFDSADVARAFEQYERAAALDPGYALPHARMSTLHTELYWWTDDRTPERAAQGEAAARRALALDPDSPDGHVALGLFYYRHRRYAEALAEYSIAEELRPGDAEAAFRVAMSLRRMNRWEESLDWQRRALALDPLDRLKLFELGSTLRRMRLWDDALDVYRRWAELYPDDPAPVNWQLWAHMNGFGDLETARSVLTSRLAATDSAGAPAGIWIALEGRAGDLASALAWANRLQGGWTNVGGVGHAGETRGRLLEALGRSEEARLAFEEARGFVESEFQARPDDRRVHSALGRVYAHLGLKEEALAAARRGVELSPLSVDPLDGSFALHSLAVTYTVAGEHDSAVEVLDQLLSIPHYLSVHVLRLEPLWSPLRERPDFQALLAKHSAPERVGDFR